MLSLLTLTACGGDGTGDADPGDARARLEQQRRDARAAAAELIGAVERTLPGTRFHPGGIYRGCEAGGLEHYASFRYEFHAGIRVSGTAAPRPFTRRLSTALREAGFEPEPPEEDDVRVLVGGAKEQLRATLSDHPEAAPDRVGVTVLGPCVEVPEEQSDEWLRRDDEEPLEER